MNSSLVPLGAAKEINVSIDETFVETQSLHSPYFSSPAFKTV
ncbi:unannotated protein [freshwater metagenome]|uniref:Unannotated protein n=1 Tax=freshwater metagenome TaxID=449393 RepID=A0A6J6CFF4_9ZZZZ